jgi:transposase-like protein
MFDRHRYPRVVILQAVYFKLRFTLSYRDEICINTEQWISMEIQLTSC